MKRLIIKFLLVIFSLVFISGCSSEKYERNGFPEKDASIKEILPDSLNNCRVTTHLEVRDFLSTKVRKIDASYCDSIVYEIYYIDDILNNRMFWDSLVNNFEDTYDKVSKKDDFYLCYKDDQKALAWYDEEYIFVIKAYDDLFDMAVDSFKYVIKIK